MSDWGDLQVFDAVARSGSVERAARALGVHHSTVLRRIAALESALGTRLFDRLPGGYALTAAGNALAEQTGAVAEQVEAAQRRLMGLDEQVRGPVRLACSDVLLQGLLMPLIARFRRRHPAVQVHVLTGVQPVPADIELRVADGAPEGARVAAVRVGELELQVCGARSDATAQGGAGGDADSARQRWVALDEPVSFPALEAWLREHVSAERIVARIDSLVGLADAVAGGLGIGLLPRPLVAGRPSMVPLAPPVKELSRPVWMIARADSLQVARLRALVAFLEEALRSDRRLMSFFEE